jgi:WD40 repeat protein
MHIIKDLDKMETRKIPVSGQVTAYTASNNGLQVFGMIDGTIYLYDNSGNVRKLVGHRSRVSRIRINENRIFSSSYDGTINVWIANSDKIEPITLYTSNNWILYFNYDRSKNYLWLGDQKGNLSQVLISVPIMVERIKHKLKRDFTQNEWNYYIGEEIPYESFTSQNGKEGKR